MFLPYIKIAKLKSSAAEDCQRPRFAEAPLVRSYSLWPGLMTLPPHDTKHTRLASTVPCMQILASRPRTLAPSHPATSDQRTSLTDPQHSRVSLPHPDAGPPTPTPLTATPCTPLAETS